MEYSEEGEHLADRSACAGVRADLKMCLLKSDCCQKDGKTPRECLKANNVPQECVALRNTFFECKRSLVRENIDLFCLDNRQRFRGRKGY
ncbi:cytochrome c oxidase assembly factor 5 [Holotrichia oblita]|uniref:Cytochrome c oxidase assembly factor 5 n=1 Tax=Holotrichia oblita TaxID=644536 RepID=A0ACB9STA1_HOLOL|nr:cytochrome c oxidase assembly factor 5 [Holotrichia oblita]